MSAKLEEGGWTPALRQMGIEVIDEIISRPISSVISDPRNGTVNTFQGIRDKLVKKKFATLKDWNNAINEVFTIAISSTDTFVQDIGKELKNFFDKKYAVLEDFSNFQFKKHMTKIIDEIEKEQSKLDTKT